MASRDAAAEQLNDYKATQQVSLMNLSSVSDAAGVSNGLQLSE